MAYRVRIRGPASLRSDPEMRSRQISAATACAASLALALAFCLTATALGAGREVGQVKAERIAFEATGSGGSTSSTVWNSMPGFVGVPIANRGRVHATFSGRFGGGSVEVRVRESGTGGGLLTPALARFSPGTMAESFSHPFVSRSGGSPACRNFVVEWRSAAGEVTTFEEGLLTLTYNFAKTRDGKPFVCA